MRYSNVFDHFRFRFKKSHRYFRYVEKEYEFSYESENLEIVLFASPWRYVHVR